MRPPPSGGPAPAQWKQSGAYEGLQPGSRSVGPARLTLRHAACAVTRLQLATGRPSSLSGLRQVGSGSAAAARDASASASAPTALQCVLAHARKGRVARQRACTMSGAKGRSLAVVGVGCPEKGGERERLWAVGGCCCAAAEVSQAQSRRQELYYSRSSIAPGWAFPRTHTHRRARPRPEPGPAPPAIHPVAPGQL